MEERLQFYIDGRWVDPADRRTLDVINPATEEPIAKIAMGNAEDVDRAVTAARKAFESFSQTSKQDRIALLQALLAGVILYLADIPGAGLVAFGVLLLCIVQIGPAPILLPVLVWIWMTHVSGFALILTLLLVPVALIDNVLKPILMARGLTTPMLVILTGVIGGTLTHGLVGLFLGPVVLSVFYELVVAWTRLGGSPGPLGQGGTHFGERIESCHPRPR